MFLSPLQILSQLELPVRPRVGDFGSGKGDYALSLAKRLGREGTVYAFEAHLPSIDALQREGSVHMPNFFALQADLNTHIPLKTNALNAAVVANTLHQLSGRQQFAKELARVLEPGGKALIVDWAGSFNNIGPLKELVLAPGEAVALFREAGFETGDMIPAGTHHFAFIATSQNQ